MTRWLRTVLIVAVCSLLAWQWITSDVPPAPGHEASASGQGTTRSATSAVRTQAAYPPEALSTLEAIRSGGPFPYDRDGSVFRNRERLLPQRPDGYYREYTVETPGSPDRGARRIVSGGDPPAEFWYTHDHYRSFRRMDVDDGR